MTTTAQSTTCSYRASDGYSCARVNYSSHQYCVFHMGIDTDPVLPIPLNPYFAPALQALISAKDGNWRGFVFPNGLVLPTKIDFRIDARDAQFGLFDQQQTEFFESVDFSGSRFRSSLILRNAHFLGNVKFTQCFFAGPARFLNVRCEQAAEFYGSEFTDRTIFRINFKSSANLNEIVFRDSVVFQGWRAIFGQAHIKIGSPTISATLTATIAGTTSKPSRLQHIVHAYRKILIRSKQISAATVTYLAEATNLLARKIHSVHRRYIKRDSTILYRVFEGEGQLDNVIFMKPDQTSFTQVDMSRVYVKGTSFTGVRLIGVNWWQPKLGRNGLFDEIFIAHSHDGPLRHQFLPVLEEACRNIRVAYEETRSFNIASDFYVAEMEASRAQSPFFSRYIFSIRACYQIVSLYGTSVPRAAGVLLFFLASHILLTLNFNTQCTDLPLGSWLSCSALHSFRILLVQTSDLAKSGPQAWIDVSLRILGIIQIAMLIFAFRSRIKRH